MEMRILYSIDTVCCIRVSSVVLRLQKSLAADCKFHIISYTQNIIQPSCEDEGIDSSARTDPGSG
jgi:hypothetical protein